MFSFPDFFGGCVMSDIARLLFGVQTVPRALLACVLAGFRLNRARRGEKTGPSPIFFFFFFFYHPTNGGTWSHSHRDTPLQVGYK